MQLGGRIAFLDQLRALAIVPVVIHHYHSDWLPGGGTGVGVFFAISGFLIGSLLLEIEDGDRNAVWRFFVRRFFRIYPLYIIAICIVALCLPRARPELAASFGKAIWHLVSMTSIPNKWFGYGVGVLWTLHIEAAFYLAAGLATLVLGARRGLYVLSALLITSTVMQSFLGQIFFDFSYWGGTLAFGTCVALAEGQLKANWRRFVPSIAGAALFFYVLLWNFNQFWLMEAGLAALIGCALITCYLIVPDIYVAPGLPFIGNISYSMYLVHGILIDYGAVIFDLGTGYGLAYFLQLTVIISTITYFTVELPSIRLGRMIANAKFLSTPVRVGLASTGAAA